MIRLNLPSYAIKMREFNGSRQIFDILRRKYVALTPEEWVRQHFVHLLTDQLHYPTALLANEVALQVGDKTVRADSVLYSPTLQPRMLIEYKAPSVPITQKVFEQISVYNLLLHADWLIVSNGLSTYCCQMDYEHRSYRFVETIPDYQNL